MFPQPWLLCALLAHTVYASVTFRKVVVSYKGKTAVVTYDDGGTDVSALTRATTGAGYPSAPRS